MTNPKIRQDVLAIHSVVQFAFEVPDLSQAIRFFEAFGLNVQRGEQHIDLYTFGHAHCWGRVFGHAPRKRLAYLTLGAYAQDLEGLRERALAHGCVLQAPHRLGDDEGFWLTDPEGVAVQVKVAEKVTPSERAPALGARTKPNAVGASIGLMRADAARVRPLRLSHLLLFTSDVMRSLAFYRDVLGLRLSDHSGDGIAFTHGAHTSDHHLLAFAKSDGPGLHHTSWVVDHLDDVGLGMQQMHAAGYTQGWGVGRHVIGSNYFYYSRDPWGSFAEFSYDIDFIDAQTEWPASDYPAEDAMHLWGPEVPDYFIFNAETAPVDNASGQ